MLPSPLAESGFAYGRSKASPDSEQIERNARKCKKRNSASVEQIQDRMSEGQERGHKLNNKNKLDCFAIARNDR